MSFGSSNELATLIAKRL